MTNKIIKWLIYTVLVGLIPILSRLLIWLVTNQGTVEMFATSDFVAFGLVLHISNINEIEHISFANNQQWKTIQNGVSIVFIAFYSILFVLTILNTSQLNFVDSALIKYCAMVLNLVSFGFSYIVYYRVSQLTGIE